MKVKILPPRKLLFPILPIKINGKLMFSLCHTCAENEHKENCTCPPHSHALTHTWCTTELTLTINMGYIILEIYEVLHWPSNEENDGSTGRGALFTEYVNMFLCMKMQASRYPNNICTLKQRQQYVEEYSSKEGVLQDPKLRVQSQFTQHSKASLELLLWKVWTMHQHVQDSVHHTLREVV